MYLNDEQLTLFKEELDELIKNGKISNYTFHNIINLFSENDSNTQIEKRDTIASLNFMQKELSRIECNILKYPHLKEKYNELIIQATKIKDGKTYCAVLDLITRLDIAMSLELNPRIVFQKDRNFYEEYYLPITNGNFKDSMYIKKTLKSNLK